MKRWLVIGIGGVGLMVSACTTYYPPPYATKAQALQAEVECKALAEQAAGPQGSLFRGVVRNDTLVKCLQSRDWSTQEVRQP